MPDVTPHEISLAVWDIDSPLVVTHSSKMKIGARCSHGCSLTGQEIVVCDAAQRTAGTNKLGSEPWPGTNALYWAEVDFIAPSTEGTFDWQVMLTALSLEPPHTIASSHFSFITVPPPEYRVTVKVVEKSTEAPIEQADVRLGMYRGRTGEAGLANVELPKGSYQVVVYKLGYQAPPKAVEVTSDVSVQIEIEPDPEPAQEYWM
jgi:hypothetical protein